MSAHFWPEFAILYGGVDRHRLRHAPYPPPEITGSLLTKTQERVRQPRWALVLV